MNTIYAVAGERNLTWGAIHSNGGTWANIGQTTKTPEKRLKDADYRRKQLAGNLIVLSKWENIDIRDKQIHDKLVNRIDVYHDADSNNTEEFLFLNDTGSGSVISQIIDEIIADIINRNENECPSFLVRERHAAIRKKITEKREKQCPMAKLRKDYEEKINNMVVVSEPSISFGSADAEIIQTINNLNVMNIASILLNVALFVFCFV